MISVTDRVNNYILLKKLRDKLLSGELLEKEELTLFLNSNASMVEFELFKEASLIALKQEETL